MKKCLLWVYLCLVMIAGCACSRDRVPDHVLEGLHKPVIKSVSPAAIRCSGAGLFLSVHMERTVDDQYVLYLNERKVGQVKRGELWFWQDGVGWMVSRELIAELLASSPDGAIVSVRITGISENYDISGDFDKYRDYVSEPVPIEISRGETQFSDAKQLFPEWTYSSEPVIRCDTQGNIYLAWLERLNGVNQAFFSFSADSGETWSQVLNISRSGDRVSQVDLAVDGAGHFYITWVVDESSDAYFCRSLDNGATWHLPVRLNGYGERAGVPSLAIDDRGDVFIACLKSDGPAGLVVRLAVSRDLGSSWEARDFAVPSGQEYWRPLLAARAGGRLDLFAGRNSTSALYLDIYSSRDHGKTWLAQAVNAGACFPRVEYPLLRFGNDDQVFIVWGAYVSARPPSKWSYFLRRDSSGKWSAIRDMDEMFPIEDTRAALSVSRASVDLVFPWQGGLILLRSRDEGGSWSVPEIVPGSDGYRMSDSPDMVYHPSGKTFLVFVKKTADEGRLYLTQFE